MDFEKRFLIHNCEKRNDPVLSIMESRVLFHPCAYALLSLGVLVSTYSVTLAHLDPRDLFTALLAELSLEQTRVGIQGLRLFHFVLGGLVISELSVGLLAVRKEENPFATISLESLSGSQPALLSTGTMKRIEDAMGSIVRTEKDSGLVREIAELRSASSRSKETPPSLESQSMDTESVDSLIDGASSLLSDKRRVADRLDTDTE